MAISEDIKYALEPVIYKSVFSFTNKLSTTRWNWSTCWISSRKIYLDELVVLRDALKRFKEKLTVKEKEQYEALLVNRRCLGKTKMKKKLENYLKDFKNSI